MDPGCPIPPDFLLALVESPNYMRLSLKKAAHAAMGGTAYRNPGLSAHFAPDVGYHCALSVIFRPSIHP
jgi:hypothetical protein